MFSQHIGTATKGTFGIDPCHGVRKWLSYNATCGTAMTTDAAHAHAAAADAAVAIAMTTDAPGLGPAAPSNIPSLPGGDPVFNVSAWVVHLPYDKLHSAHMHTVDATCASTAAATAATAAAFSTTTTSSSDNISNSTNERSSRLSSIISAFGVGAGAGENDLGRVWELCRYRSNY
jgi:hypothetical protein